MEIEVLGFGCQRCDDLLGQVERAVADLGLRAEVRMVEDPAAIGRYGLVSTPAIAVNGEVKLSGGSPLPGEIYSMLTTAALAEEEQQG